MMIRNLKLTVRLALVLTVFFPLSLFAQYSGGNGSKANPYIIADVIDLVTLSDNVASGEQYKNTYFKLSADIDMSVTVTRNGKTWTGGSNFTPIGYQNNDNNRSTRDFFGSFDGDGHTISNLIINDNTHTNVALFGRFVNDDSYADNAEIKNLGLINPSITVTTSAAYLRAGCLVGYGLNNAKISNCFISNGTITVTNGGDNTHIAGILAYNGGGTEVTNCAVNGLNINCNETTNLNIGGIVGKNDLGSNVDLGYSSDCTANNEPVSSVGYSTGTTGEHVYPPAPETDNPTEEQINEIIQSMVESSNGTWYADEYGINDGLPVNKEKYEQAKQQAENGSVYTLWVGRWNFVGSIGSQFSYFNSNGNSLGNDIAALQWDYETNDWNSTFLYAKDDMVSGMGYFVYPFAYTVLSKEDIANGITQGNPLSNKTISYSPTSLLTSGTFSKQNWENKNSNGATGSTTSGVWFLCSNPFNRPVSTSSISIDNLQGNGTSTAIFTYDSYSKTWKNPEKILPGQGFAFAVYQSSGTYQTNISINYPSKKDELQQTFTPLTFTCKQGYYQKSAFAYMNDKASNGFDNMDSYIRIATENESLVEPYFVVEQRNLIFNMFESLPYECPINFHASKESETEFYLTNNPENMEISIVDLVDNSETVISDGTKFTFTAYEGENEGRFLIKFAPSKNVSLTEVTDSEINVNIYNNNKEIFINGDNLTHIQVINSLGQTVYNKNISGNSYSCNLNTPSGAYIVKIQTLNGTKTQKIIVK